MIKHNQDIPKTENTVDVIVRCLNNGECYIDRFEDCQILNQFTMSLLSRGYSVKLNKINNVKNVDFELNIEIMK